MKRCFLLLLALTLLCGCGSADAPGTTAGTTEDVIQTNSTEAALPEPAASETQAPAMEITVSFYHMVEGENEYALLIGQDSGGNEIWSYETERYGSAQLNRVSDIGQWENQYYFVDDGDTVALNTATGEILWRNSDFSGSPASLDATYIDTDGAVYLCSFMGPDLYAVSPQGETLLSIDVLDTDYYWAYRLEKAENQITVYFSGGPEGDIGQPGYGITVDLTEY